MTVIRSLPLRTLKKQYLDLENCHLEICSSGLNVYVHVRWKGIRGVVSVSMPPESTVRTLEGRTTTWFFLGNPDAFKAGVAGSGAKIVSVKHA